MKASETLKSLNVSDDKILEVMILIEEGKSLDAFKVLRSATGFGVQFLQPLFKALQGEVKKI